ncbi:MAG: hypothetical protein PHD05_00240 [Sphaerochaetaceae bacterium]|nr:hypothetical protein [Sphaerochaetaceae bacterium]
MNYDNLKPNILTQQKIFVNKKTIFVLFPDTNVDIASDIYNLTFLLSNCKGIICPNKIISIGHKNFNGKEHFYNVKKQMLQKATDQNIAKQLRVYNSSIIEKDKKNIVTSQNTAMFYFFDSTVWSKGFDFLIQTFSERYVFALLINEFAKLYKQIKEKNVDYDVDFIFLIKNQSGRLLNLITNIRMLIKKDEIENMQFFDNYVTIHDCQTTIMPLLNREDGKTKIIIPNLSKIFTHYNTNEVATDLEGLKESPIADSKKETEIPFTVSQNVPEEDLANKPNNNLITNIVQTLKSSSLVASSDGENYSNKIKIELNQQDLKKALKHYKITDPDIVANVQIALNTYIKTNNIKPSQEKAEELVLKAINFTLNGTNTLTDEQLNRPDLLFEKLKQLSTYKVPLNIYETNNIINPKELIDLKYTTGQHRQKFEFETAIHENITKLFGSLESIGTEFPIKVKKITHEVVDNNKDRYINYKITLQNLNGGKKEPYDVELFVPSPVNEKYFKLHNNSYIMSNQQFLRPITKTDKNKTRLISNYAIVHVGLENSKYTPIEVNEILKYIELKYNNLIKKLTDSYCEFTDGSILYLTGEKVYQSKNQNITTDPNTTKLIDLKNNNTIKQNKFEFIFEILLDKIHSVNPQDNLSKTKKALPYLWIHIGGIKMPLILYLWSQKGLLNTLNDFEINYEIVDSISDKTDLYYVKLADGKFLKMNPEGLKQQLFLNAFLTNIKLKNPIKDLTDPTEIYDYISHVYGSKSILRIRLLTENFVDPITKELLQFESQPTNLVDLSSKVAVDKLLNGEVESLSDLRIYRARLSEIILNLIYKQIKLSHNFYRKKVLSGETDASLFLVPESVINILLTTAGILQNAEPVTPISEIMLASRITKGGKGGVPSRKAFKKEHRNIHPSQYGNISAISTPEYVDVGLTIHHTLTPIISNKYGSYGAKTISDLSCWQMLTIDESLTPFQNQVDSDRLTLARTHINQATPINDSEQPLVCSGAEFIVPQLSSSRFIHLAKQDGTVIDVDKNKIITIKYADNSIHTFDIIPRISRTKRGSYIALEMHTLKAGEKFKANQPIAFTKNFNHNGVYCGGKNLNVAIFNYLGYNHEDSYVISKKVAEQTTTDIIDEIDVVIPPGAKVITIENEIGKILNDGDTLVEFTFNLSIDEYLENSKIMSDELGEESFNLLISHSDENIKKLATAGEIVDIKVYINNPTTVDAKIKNFHQTLVKEQKQIIKKLSENVKSDDLLSVTDNMNLSFIPTGGHKLKGNIFNGTRIVYRIKRTKSINIGDKLSNRYGAKGVVSKILETTTKGKFTNEIDIFISPSSVLGRRNIALLKELYLGKIFYNANLQLEQMSEDSKITNDKIAKFIVDLYHITGPKKLADQIEANVNSYTGSKLRQAIKNDEINLFCVVEPFEDISFQQIRDAAKFINIPLEEKVYISELDQWTDVPVPVGISYTMVLEHYSDVYANVRGTGKFTSLTRQPTKRKSQEGGQSIGGLDLYAFLTYDANNIISELLGPRSDEHKTKRELYNEIIENGEMPLLPTVTKTGGTKDIFNLFILGMGLSIN